jgi:protoheme IX farnesyltransferase
MAVRAIANWLSALSVESRPILRVSCPEAADLRGTARVVLTLRLYLALTKPRIVALITFTALVGELLAGPTVAWWRPVLWGTLGIALCSACAAVLNQVFERQLDASMSRTRRRPLAAGLLTRRNALLFAAALGVTGSAILTWLVNPLTATLTVASLIGYGVIYTVWLKPATSQNIVIGGVAGAAPPVLGWAAATDEIGRQALLLFLIVLLWTPPHFWSLAIARRNEYAPTGIPMLPVTRGVPHTQWQILLYTVLLALATLLPFLTHMSGIIYLCAALILDAMFVSHALRLKTGKSDAQAMQTFRFSVQYLMWLFAALLADHYLAFAW